MSKIEYKTVFSFFLNNEYCYVYTYEASYIYHVSELQKIADKVPMFIENSLPNTEISKVLYSAGPLSFTTTRIVNSVIKGMKIVNSNIEFIGISNFLTYLSIIGNDNGIIAIPTYRGDYFISSYRDYKLSDISIDTIENKKSGNIYSDDMFKTSQLAQQQFLVLNTNIEKVNRKFITYSTDILYNITPIFKKNSA